MRTIVAKGTDFTVLMLDALCKYSQDESNQLRLILTYPTGITSEYIVNKITFERLEQLPSFKDTIIYN